MSRDQQQSKALREHPNYSWMVEASGKTFRVHTGAYTEPGVYRAELENIFSRSWIYVAHTSQIQNRGDYVTSYIGDQPVIVVRDQNDRVVVLINRCVHRGAALCREAQGNKKVFVCPYHGWSFDLSGKLIAISDRNIDGGYDDDFEAPKGLYEVPKVEIYRGFVFANLNTNAGPLLEHLGRAKDIIDTKLNMSPVGEISLASKPYIVRYKGNWKFQAENIIDAYHFLYVHAAFGRLQTKYEDSTGDFGVHKPGKSHAERRNLRYHGSTFGCVQGHGIAFQPEGNPDNLKASAFAEVFQQLSTQYDEETLCRIGGKCVGSIFPNLGIIHHQVRTWRPLGPDLTEVIVYPYDLVGVDPKLNAGMLRSQERFYGPSGYGMPDDVDIFSQNTEGLRGSAVEWLILERGIGSDQEAGDGDKQGFPSSELTQRAIWRKWASMMKGGEG